MRWRDGRLRQADALLRSLPPQRSPKEQARVRWNDGTLRLEDVDLLVTADELEQLQVRLVNLSLPYRRVRAAGHAIRDYFWALHALSYLLSFSPDEEVPADLLDRIRDGIEPRLLPPQWNGPSANIEEHRIFVVGRRTVGADDGLPLRRAIFAGEYGRGPAMAVPPAGVGASRCPLSCAWPRPTERCLCSGQSDDLWFRTTPTTGAERQRASHWQTQHRTDAAKLGQPRPGQPVGLPVHNPTR